MPAWTRVITGRDGTLLSSAAIWRLEKWKALKQIVVTGIKTEPPPAADETVRVASRLQDAILKQLGRALTVRHVVAGSCNGCELEIHAVNNTYYGLESLGIKFVASLRHADLLQVTGPVSDSGSSIDALPNRDAL